MYHYEYAIRKVRKPIRDQIIELIKLVQKDLKNEFTFQYKFEGSDKFNLVTYDPRTNTGFDFDVNLYPNDEKEKYSAKELKTLFINSFNKFTSKFGFDYCENSSRVITIKVKDKKHSKVLYSVDFAVVNDYYDNENYWHQEIVFFNKGQNSYYWQEQPQTFYEFYSRIDAIKENGLWQEVRDLYLEKKNNNINQNKKSRSLRIETINEIYQRNFDE